MSSAEPVAGPIGAAIYVNIVDKRHPAGWRIIGDCPQSVCESGGLHLYIGRSSVLRDSSTDRVLVEVRSLRDLLRKAANTFDLPVVLTDEVTMQVTRFEPTARASGAK